MGDINSQLPSAPEPRSDLNFAALEQMAANVEPRLRLWPGLLIVAAMWLAILVPRWVAPGTMGHFMAMMWSPMIAAAAIAVWWLFASRLRWTDRILGLLAFGAVGAAVYPVCHSS